jgi:hypothetical protein
MFPLWSKLLNEQTEENLVLSMRFGWIKKKGQNATSGVFIGGE